MHEARRAPSAEAEPRTVAVRSAQSKGVAPRSVLATMRSLQRGVGNQAVLRLMAQRSAANAPVVVQRLEVKVDIDKTSHTIKSISYPDKDRPSGNIRGATGDHTTAYRTFLAMIRNQLMGQNISNVAAILRDLLLNLKGMPGMQKQSADFLHESIMKEVSALPALKTKEDVAAVLENIVSIRNQMPLSSIANSTTSGGHGESGNVALLNDCEDRYRRGDKQQYTVDDMLGSLWALFDYVPINSTDDAEIASVIAQHFYSMQLSFPKVMQNINGLDLMLKFLQKDLPITRKKGYTPNVQTLIFSKIADQKRVDPILNIVAKAVQTGPSALPKIGASKNYEL